MPLLLAESNWPQTIDHIERAYYKLALIVGPTGSGKSTTLRDFSKSYNVSSINLGLELSEALLSTPSELRPVEAEKVALSLISRTTNRRLAIDNTEVLFEAPLKIDPLRFLKEASKGVLIVATWTGEYRDDILTYGIPGHPAFRKYNLQAEDSFTIIPASLLI